MSAVERRVLAIVEASLDMSPAEWEFTPYEAVNRRLGASIWIANGYYGVSVRLDIYEVGGVTAFSSFFGWLTWRRRILDKVVLVQAARLGNEFPVLTPSPEKETA